MRSSSTSLTRLVGAALTTTSSSAACSQQTTNFQPWTARRTLICNNTRPLFNEALLKSVTRRREWEKSLRSAVSEKKDAHEDRLQEQHERVYSEGRYISVDDAFPLGDPTRFKPEQRQKATTQQSGEQQRQELSGLGGEEAKIRSENINLTPAADKQARLSPPPEADHHVARIAIVGPPNAGKSSLMNALCSSRVSAAADREGVTKDWVKGVMTIHNTQLIFLDTPGLFKVDGMKAAATKRKMKDQHLHHTHAAWDSLMGADICLLAYPIGLGYLPSEHKTLIREVLFKCEKREMPVILCFTKSDILTTGFKKSGGGGSGRGSFGSSSAMALTLYKELRADLDSSGLGDKFAKTVEVSNTHFTGHLELKDLLCLYAKPRPWKYFPQQKCAMTDAQRVQELITEKLFKYLPGNIPHRCKVRVIGWTPTSSLAAAASAGGGPSSVLQGSAPQNSILVDTEIFFERPTFTALFLQKKLAISMELKQECQSIFRKKFTFQFHCFITPGGIKT